MCGENVLWRISRLKFGQPNDTLVYTCTKASSDEPYQALCIIAWKAHQSDDPESGNLPLRMVYRSTRVASHYAANENQVSDILHDNKT